jgi:hypothetical protein
MLRCTSLISRRLARRDRDGSPDLGYPRYGLGEFLNLESRRRDRAGDERKRVARSICSPRTLAR